MIEKGFWKSRNLIVEACKAYELEYEVGNLSDAARAAVNCQALALVGTEVSEMVEGIRHGNGPDDKIPEFSAAEAEAADVYLRLMDLAHGNGWRVAEAVIAKIAMNKTRAAMHGGKQF
jgi:NTP pyrophosphatase (non-canonical NTP hydrolase)